VQPAYPAGIARPSDGLGRLSKFINTFVPAGNVAISGGFITSPGVGDNVELGVGVAVGAGVLVAVGKPGGVGVMVAVGVVTGVRVGVKDGTAVGVGVGELVACGIGVEVIGTLGSKTTSTQ